MKCGENSNDEMQTADIGEAENEAEFNFPGDRLLNRFGKQEPE